MHKTLFEPLSDQRSVCIFQFPCRSLHNLERLFNLRLMRAKAENADANGERAVEQGAGEKELSTLDNVFEQPAIETINVSALRPIAKSEDGEIGNGKTFESGIFEKAVIQPLRQAQLFGEIVAEGLQTKEFERQPDLQAAKRARQLRRVFGEVDLAFRRELVLQIVGGEHVGAPQKLAVLYQ